MACSVGGGIVSRAVVTWAGVIFSTWVGASRSKLVVALVLLVICLRLRMLSIREQSA